MAPAVEDIMVQAGVPAGADMTFTALKGGLSHRVLRVDVGGQRYVLRILDPAVSKAGLGIPLDQEIENTVRAAREGVGARVVHVAQDPPSIVLEYIEGVTLGRANVRRAEMIPKIAAACRRLHALPGGFGNTFDIFDKQRELLGLCRRHDLPVPGDYADYLPVLADIERAVKAMPLAPVPCHNDLLPENFMDDGWEIRIIDYQLSGMNDPAFELGNIAAEADFEPDKVEDLVSAYCFQRLTPFMLARVRLYLAVSNATWTLWFSIHHGLLADQAADFDYRAEAADKWAQAVRDFSDPGLGGLIDLVGGGRR